MQKKYNEAITSINKILNIIDEIGEDQFRKCLKSFIDDDIRINLPKESISMPCFHANKQCTTQKAILSYQKSLTLK